MGRRTLVILLVLALTVVVWDGCRSTRTSSGASTGAGGYVTGNYQKVYPYSVADTFNTSLSMLEQNRIPVYRREVGATVGTIEGTLADGKTLTMDFKAIATNKTQVNIKVGTFGDSARSNYFFEQLDGRLGTRGTAVGATTTTPSATGSVSGPVNTSPSTTTNY